jgi:hypothetical protein
MQRSPKCGKMVERGSAPPDEEAGRAQWEAWYQESLESTFWIVNGIGLLDQRLATVQDQLAKNSVAPPREQAQEQGERAVPAAAVAKAVRLRPEDVGYTMASIFGPYMVGADHVEVNATYMRSSFQVKQLAEFLEACLTAGVRVVRVMVEWDSWYY